jgi:hypothetical protein
MNDITHREIKQLIPANGWFAEHTGDGDEIFYIPITCFALCECIEERYQEKEKKWHKHSPYEQVCPMVGGGDSPIDFCEDNSNYKGIVLRVSKHRDTLTNTI